MQQLTSLAEDGKLTIVTSTLTIAEVLRDPSDLGDPLKNFDKIKKYFEQPWIVVRAVDRRISELAAEIRLSHKLKIPDAIHVATAIRWKVKHLHSYDEGHLLKKTKLIGNPPLEICTPCYPEEYPLFDRAEDEPTVLKLPMRDREAETAESSEGRTAASGRDPGAASGDISTANRGDESAQFP